MLVVLINAAVVVFMTGFIWTIQVVHYPLFDRVGAESFVRYEADHGRHVVRLVAPGFLATGVTSVALLVSRPDAVPLAAPVAGMLLFAITLFSTARWQIPQHQRLGRGFDRDAHARLVATNWVRTVAWSCHALLALWMLWRSA